MELQANQPVPRSQRNNVTMGRWVLCGSLIDGCKMIRASLAIRRFMHKHQGDLDAARYTARRTACSLILSNAVKYGWRWFSWHSGKACLQGLSCEELAAAQGGLETGTLRETGFERPADVFTLLQDRNKFKGASRSAACSSPGSVQMESRALRSCGRSGHQSMFDFCIQMWLQHGVLVGVLSTHIGDLRGAGDESWQEWDYGVIVTVFKKV